MPDYVFVRTVKPPKVTYEGLPPDIVPLRPKTTPIQMKFAKAGSPEARRVSQTVTQLPMLAGFAMTTDKVRQGKEISLTVP
jgi:hypothetical protein